MAGMGGLQLKATQPTGANGALAARAKEALQRVFGFAEYRGRQEEAVLGVLQGRDVFVLMPTGGGKSLCYGLPPLVKKGVAVVVSPLIALMQDQVNSFRAKGVSAELLSSAQPAAERRRVLADLDAPQPATQLLFVTPELLDAGGGFIQKLQWLYSSGNLLMMAVDEAHCISSWGHDFRHAFRRLWVIRQELQGVPIMALTATASQRVQDDICQQLRLRNPLRLVSTFNRPNITYEVRYVDTMLAPHSTDPLTEPLPDLVALLERERVASPDGRVPCCVVYTHKRETADIVAHQLSRRGIPCRAYHAGLPDAERSRVLAEWTSGEVQAVAATVAFGMGIDRADVRLVVHYNLPKSVEGFYQESGRAGRDGAPARSICYFSIADRQSLEYVLEGGQAKGKRQRPEAQQGADGRPMQLQHFGQVVTYCLSARCRRSFLLAHFGETLVPARRPGCCDVCDDPARVAAALRELQTAGAARRQRFLGGRSTLEFGGGGSSGRSGSALEFETDRPSEGLDFDEEGHRAFFQEEDGIEGGSDSGEDAEGGRAAAQAALKLARSSGVRDADGVLTAMAAAERRYERQEAAAEAGRGSKSRLLAKLEGGGGGGGAAGQALPGAGSSGGAGSSVPEALRAKARAQLGAAIAGNPRLAAALTGACGEAAAVELEAECWRGVQSKPVYQSKMANLVGRLRRAAAPGDVPPLAVLLGEGPAGGGGGQQGGQGPAQEERAAQAGQQQQAQQHLVQQETQQAGQQQAEQRQAGQRDTWQAEQQQQPEQVVAESEQQEARQAAQQAGQRHAEQPISADALGTLVEQACGSGGPEQAAGALRALGQLAAARVTPDLLLQTGAGRRVRALTKHADPALAAAAGEVFSAWKAAVLAATSGTAAPQRC